MNGFASKVRVFSLGALSLIGNCANGCVIGLTGQGAQDCERYSKGTIDVAELERRQPELAHAFRQYGFFHEDDDERKPLQSAYLHVTDRCNMNCVGCYSRSSARNVIPDLSLDAICSIINKLACAEVETLHISGGEPALRSDLCSIVEHAKATGIARVDLATNGLLAFAGLDLSRLASCIDSVSVSVDGLPDDSVHAVRSEERKDQQLQAIRIPQSQGIDVAMLPTIHARNVEDIPAYADLAAKMGVRINYSMLSCSACNRDLGRLAFTEDALHRLAEVIVEQASQSSQHDELPALSVRLSCGAGKTTLSVGADGNAYPCHMLQAPEYCMGNLLHNSLDAILASPVRRELESATVENIDGCSLCDYRYLCGGGCRARAAIVDGPHTKDPYCTLLKTHYAKVENRMEEIIGG